MNKQSFFFYDLETSGLSPRDDRIMQFAGQRTTMDLEPIGEPVNLLVKLSDDTLPSPYAIMTTKITPQQTLQDGMSEAELAHYLQEEIFTPQTCVVGYNSVRFDDEFMRHLFWRTFFDPYEWQWQDGRSRWDLLDVVRMTRALRPEGINWPVNEEGRATNRLELLTKENGISHEHAHDALSDVEALISVTKLVKEHQPQLYNYLFEMRNKRKVQKLVNLENKQAFVYSSGRYSGEYEKTTVAFPIAPGRNGNVLVFDLRYNLDELLAKKAEEEESGEKNEKGAARKGFFPIVKELAYNKCPAVAPLVVLEKDGGWEKIKFSKEEYKKNLDSLLGHPEFAERMREEIERTPEWPPAIDVEAALYDGFVPEPDRVRCNAVRNADANKLADFHPTFIDARLTDLLLHYKARNYPSALDEGEQAEWRKYREARLTRQAEGFLKGMEALSRLAAEGKAGGNGQVPDEFLLEELRLYYQSLSDAEY
ncbi:exodeoxyribonuclease I [Candidatus Saccharibacteria bacterium]|nr:exodeoxyribonuclease I [Candidatus Saccharibacteria bacterium]